MNCLISRVNKLFRICLCFLICIKIIVAFDCKQLFPFYENRGGKEIWGFIDSKGKVVVEPTFIDQTSFCNGYSVVRLRDSDTSLVRTQLLKYDGTVISFDNVEFLRSACYSEGLILVIKDSKLVYIDLEGKTNLVLPLDPVDDFEFYEDGIEIFEAFPFTNGRAGVFTKGGICIMSKRGKFECESDKKGVLYHTFSFEKNVEVVKKIDKLEFFNLGTGKKILEVPGDIQFTVSDDGTILTWSEGNMTRYYSSVGNLMFSTTLDSSKFSNGYAVYKSKGKWGFINRKGNIVIPAQYEYASGFTSEGIARVGLDGKIGFIDARNQVVVPFMFSNYPFSNYYFPDKELDFYCGITRMIDGNTKGYIDRDGNWVWKQNY